MPMIKSDMMSGQHDPVGLTEWPPRSLRSPSLPSHQSLRDCFWTLWHRRCTTRGNRLGDAHPLVTTGWGCLGVQIFHSRGLRNLHRQGLLPRTRATPTGNGLSVLENQLEPHDFIGQASEQINDLISASAMCQNGRGLPSIFRDESCRT